MAKKQKLTKAAKQKLLKAADVIKNFSSVSAIGDIINITDSYRINNNGSPLTFSLVFNTVGVGAITTAVLHDAINDVDLPVVKDARDSLVDQPINTDTVANRKFLKISSTVAATPLTAVPVNLDVDFSISGGIENTSYPIPAASFKAVGDQVILDISIFFF